MESPNIVKQKGKDVYNYVGTRKEFNRYYEKLSNNKPQDIKMNLREVSKGNSDTMKYDGPPTIDFKYEGKQVKIKFKGNGNE